MDGCDETLLRRRVVVLGDGPALASHLAEVLGRAAAVVRADSGFEAAAELLARPCDVLVVDFRRLPPLHVPLLDVAREKGTEILAMGTTPDGVPIERLSGIRLVSRADLPDAVLRALPHAEQAAAHHTPAPAPTEPPGRQADPTEPPGPGKHAADHGIAAAPADTQAPLDARPATAPADRTAAPPNNGAPADRKTPPAGNATPPQPEPPGPAPEAPSRLLTPEELAALLEDGP